VFNPQIYENASGVNKPPREHDLEWFTDHIEDNPDFYEENTCVYDGITSTTGWQQMDFYTVAENEDWMRDQYETIGTTDPRSFWSTSTMGGWIGNGEVAYGMGMAQWIIARFTAQDFDLGYEGAPLWWSNRVTHNLQWPNWQVTDGAENPNSAKLFVDWTNSPHGQAHASNEWYLGPGRNDIPDEELREDPVWGVSTNPRTIQENVPFVESIFMDFDDRTVRSDQKAKYKDMWYNIMT
jgi:hypothetical protein